MSKDLQKQLAELLAGLMNFASDAKQFAAQQIPPLVQEKITLGRVEESIYFAACMALFAGGMYALWHFWKWGVAAGKEDDDMYGPLCLGSLLILAISVVPPLRDLHDFLLVWFAPRLYIVEWLKTMVTK